MKIILGIKRLIRIQNKLPYSIIMRRKKRIIMKMEFTLTVICQEEMRTLIVSGKQNYR